MGYAQRNFMTPLPEVDSYTELKALLERACRENLHRHVRGKEAPVLELWEEEKAKLLPLPPKDFAACVSYPVKPNGYSSSGSLKENFDLQSGPCRHGVTITSRVCFPQPLCGMLRFTMRLDRIAHRGHSALGQRGQKLFRAASPCARAAPLVVRLTRC